MRLSQYQLDVSGLSFLKILVFESFCYFSYMPLFFVNYFHFIVYDIIFRIGIFEKWPINVIRCGFSLNEYTPMCIFVTPRSQINFDLIKKNAFT